jgi:soluble lytic murein transglycosylase-like protein
MIRFAFDAKGGSGRSIAAASVARAAVGIAAVLALVVALGGASVEEAQQTAESAAAPPAALGHPLAAAAEPPSLPHDAVGAEVARRFRIAADAAHEVVGAARLAGQAAGIDPLLVLAVIAIESRFNPIAESDYGARGLMQVVARFHPEKLPGPAGERALLDPWTNIHVGTRILREYLDRTGDLESALQLYGGAADDPERAYARKVLGELERFRRVAPAAARGAGGRAS